MNYIEHIYVCLAAPILVAAFCMKKIERRTVLFMLGGMTACLLSSYISTFLAYATGADMFTASLTISPVVEEVMKLLPALFYLLVFEPDHRDVLGGLVMTGIGFANFENVCYMTSSGTSQLRDRGHARGLRGFDRHRPDHAVGPDLAADRGHGRPAGPGGHRARDL